MQPRTTSEVIDRFNNAFQRHDATLLNDLIADHCIIENTQPAPDGARHEGRDACLALWQSIATAPDLRFDLEDVFVAGEKAVIRWRLWSSKEARTSVRGVNLMTVRDGKIVEGLGYVKGA